MIDASRYRISQRCSALTLQRNVSVAPAAGVQ